MVPSSYLNKQAHCCPSPFINHYLSEGRDTDYGKTVQRQISASHGYGLHRLIDRLWTDSLNLCFVALPHRGGNGPGYCCGPGLGCYFDNIHLLPALAVSKCVQMPQ